MKSLMFKKWLGSPPVRLVASSVLTLLSETQVLASQIESRISYDLCKEWSSVYEKEVKAKILRGVPFEVMSIWVQEEEVLKKQVVRVEYDLWDEILRISSEGESARSVKLKDAEKALCQEIGEWRGQKLVRPGSASMGSIVIEYKVILNPLWAGKLARMRQAWNGGAQSPNTQSMWISVSWDRLSEKISAEKVLVSQKLNYHEGGLYEAQ